MRLIERGERLLSSFSPKSSQKVKDHLESLGVKVMLKTEISQIESNCIHLKKDGRLRSDLTIWGAGVEPLRLPGYLQTGDEKGVLCDPDLSLSIDNRVFIIGDQSHIEGRNLPSLAPVAIQQGARAAKNILADLNGSSRKVFDYKNRGALAVVGRKYAVAQIFGVEFTGFFAWCIWCFIHIVPLINFRSKFFVFCEFAWAYFNYRRGVRIITRQRKRD